MWEKCFYDFQNWYKSKETVRERCTDPGLLFIFRIRRMYFPIFLMVLYLLVLKHWRVFRNGLTVLSVQYLGTLSLVKSSDTASAHLQSLSIFRRSNWTVNTFFLLSCGSRNNYACGKTSHFSDLFNSVKYCLWFIHRVLHVKFGYV